MPQIIDKILLKKIAVRIKNLREANNVSQQDVYNDININLARIETGKYNFSVSTLNKLCEYFDISLSEFFKKM